MQNRRNIPINQTLSQRNFEFEIEFETTYNGAKHVVNYFFSFVWAKNNKSGLKISKELLKIKAKGPKKYFSNFIKRDFDNAFFKSSEKSRCNNPISVKNQTLVIDKLGVLDQLHFHSAIEDILELKINLNNHSDPKKWFDNPPPPLERLEESNFEPLTEPELNFPKVTHFLKFKHKDKFSLLRDAFVRLFPNIETIDVKEYTLKETVEVKINKKIPFKFSNKIYRIWVKEKNNNQPTDFSFLSNGTKRVFMLLTATVLAEINKVPLIAFEELENCVHPKLFQSLLTVLGALAKKCRILLTSHSPFMIQYLALSRIYLGIPNNNGTSFFKKVKKKYFKKIQTLALDEHKTTGDYIFDLLIEAEDDNSDLLEWVEQ
jgi:hypothetical protein